jgi:hypothetical protein
MVTVAFLLVPAGGRAQQGFFEEGNRRYQEGDYQGALESYLSIRDAGYESGELYYNIGNTYFKLGNLGRSIVNYERALKLMPRDDDARANLELARSLAADEITPLPGFWLFRAIDWWVHALPRTWLLLVVAAAYLFGSAGIVAHVLGYGQLIVRWGRRLAIAGGVMSGCRRTPDRRAAGGRGLDRGGAGTECPQRRPVIAGLRDSRGNEGADRPTLR